MTVYVENYDPNVQQNGLNTLKTVDFSGATSVALPANTTIAGTTATGTSTITSTSANALTVGRQGATNPVLKIDASAATVVTGISVVGAAAAAGVAIAAISSGTDESLTINAKGAGTVTVNGISTGNTIINNGIVGETQAITGSGAVNVTTLITKLNSTGGGTYTLANGVDGQVKIILLDVDGGDATVSPTTSTGFTSIVFDNAGDAVTLVYATTRGWICVGNNGGALS